MAGVVLLFMYSLVATHAAAVPPLELLLLDEELDDEPLELLELLPPLELLLEPPLELLDELPVPAQAP